MRLSHGMVATHKCMARNFCANDFSILLWSCARRIMKIRQYL